MAFFGRKKDRVLDLTERYKKQLDIETQQAAEKTVQENTGFDFFGNMASASQQPQTENSDMIEETVAERKRKLAKRLADMTSKIEEISNQIYHLQQRIEVLERKAGVRIE